MIPIIKAGQLIKIDKGQYSDYAVIGFFVALQPLDTMSELEAFLTEYPEQREDYCFDSDAFIAHLLRGGYLLEIEHATIYLSGYSSASEVEIHPLKAQEMK